MINFYSQATALVAKISVTVPLAERRENYVD